MNLGISVLYVIPILTIMEAGITQIVICTFQQEYKLRSFYKIVLCNLV